MTMLARQHSDPNNEAALPRRTKPAANASTEIKYRTEAADYVAAMLAELRQISAKAGFEKLVGVLDAAYYEAYTLNGSTPKAPQPQGENNTPPMEPSRS